MAQVPGRALFRPLVAGKIAYQASGT